MQENSRICYVRNALDGLTTAMEVTFFNETHNCTRHRLFLSVDLSQTKLLSSIKLLIKTNFIYFSLVIITTFLG